LLFSFDQFCLGSVFSRSSVNAIEQQANKASELDYTLKNKYYRPDGTYKKDKLWFHRRFVNLFCCSVKTNSLISKPNNENPTPKYV